MKKAFLISAFLVAAASSLAAGCIWQNEVKADLPLAQSKTYDQLSDGDKKDYIREKMEKLSVSNGMNSSEFPSDNVDQVKGFLESYSKRKDVPSLDRCAFGSRLSDIYERAAKNAPAIISAFNAEKADPIAGLYIAMIESEHCPCLQSPTGPLGLFQLTAATGEKFGLKAVKGATPDNPDERCDISASSKAAAKYFRSLMAETDLFRDKTLYAVTVFNSGDGVCKDVLNGKKSLKPNKQFEKQCREMQRKYVSKFFAAAIIGENPADFGLSIQPLSSYTGNK